MNHRIRFLSVLLAAALVASAALLGAVPAYAVRTVMHGQGVMWAVDHSSWIGSYLLDDGSTGYCIDVEKPQPSGTDVDYVDGSTTGEYSAADSARLAYISRHYGSPSDPLTAAAAQLATWTVAGLGGHDQAWFARRANAAAADVVTSANRLLAIANGPGGASTGVSARVTLDLAGPGGAVRSELDVDFLAGRSTLPPGSFTGRVTLTGATFDDGSRTRSLPNGTTVHILPDQHGATKTVSAEVVYRDLPFGPGFRLGRNRGPNQSLLVDHPFPREARAAAEATAPSDVPFTPRVVTETSSAVAVPGAAITDVLDVQVHPGSETQGAWGVYSAPDGTLAPIPVTVSSVLHGPFTKQPVRGDAPAHDPIVCIVETLATGPRRYETPPCTIPAPGFYVWTASVDPARTPPEQGGDRLRAWSSLFGEAAETTLAPATPHISTTATVTTPAHADAAATTIASPPPAPAPTATDANLAPTPADQAASTATPPPTPAPAATDATPMPADLVATTATPPLTPAPAATTASLAPTPAGTPGPGGEGVAVRGAACVADSLRVTGLPPGIDPITVHSTLLGPIPVLPPLDEVPADWREFPVAGRVTTSIDADGDHTSPCIRITEPGHYYFVVESESGPTASLAADEIDATDASLTTSPTSDADLTETEARSSASPAPRGDEHSGVSLVQSFSDYRVHTSESVILTALPPSATPPTPVASPPAPPSPSARLPLTGSPSGPTALGTAAGIAAVMLGLALAGLAGSTLPRRRGRR